MSEKTIGPLGRNPASTLGRVSWLACVAALVAFLGAATMSQAWSLPGPGGDARIETPDANYLLGNLTWNAGKGGVSWSPDPTTEESVGPPADPSAVAQGAAGPLPDAVQFVSDPLPFAMHLNVSRLIQLDLRVKITYATASTGTACQKLTPSVGVELLAGDTLVAGSPSLQSSYPYPYARPLDPMGYETWYYRMPAEVTVLPQGTQLKLVILYSPHLVEDQLAVGACPRQFGLGEDERSALRIPYWPAQEVFFRDPALAGSDPFGMSDANGPAGASAGGARSASGGAGFLAGGGLGGAAIGGFAFHRRRSHGTALFLAALLLAGSFAGCLGAGHPKAGPGLNGPAGKATSTIQGEGGTGLSGKGLGAVLGQIHDDLKVPLRGAYVTVVGTSNFTTTDQRGWFVLRDVPPGAYQLRVEAEAYHALETPVQVKAQSVTRVNGELVPLVATGSDARPHYHDAWGGMDAFTLVDEDLGASCPPVTAAAAGITTCNPATGIGLPAKATGALPTAIVPGTYEVQVVVTWDAAAMGVQNVGLEVEANNDPSPSNQTWYYPRASGVPFAVQGGWEMDDPGHQVFSTWRLSLYVSDASGDGQQYLATPSTTPSFHVKITLHKGVVPLEPAHPDHWAGRNVAAVAATKIGSDTWAPANCNEGRTSPDVAVFYASTYPFLPSNLVPAGTTWLDVKFTLSRDTSPHTDWRLYVHPTSAAPLAGGYVNGGRYMSPDLSSFKAVTTAPVRHGNDYVWHVPIADPENDPDGIYAKKTSWAFATMPMDATSYCIDYWANFEAEPPANAGPLLEAWTVTAHRDAMPS